MKYDFTSIIDRHGMDARAVDFEDSQLGPRHPTREGFDLIPMWVADMNFRTVPTVMERMAQRLKHPLFGYFSPRQEYFDSIISWQSRRNGVEGLKPENIGYVNGVLGGVVSMANVLCSKGDKILVHAPTYVGFTHALVNNGYELVHTYLQKDEAGIWRMDYADMEKKLREQHIHCAILCSPHNPCGRVWERWELEKAMELFKKYNVYVISDEIWSDLTLSGYKHIPTQSVSEDAKMRTAAMYALLLIQGQQDLAVGIALEGVALSDQLFFYGPEAVNFAVAYHRSVPPEEGLHACLRQAHDGQPVEAQKAPRQGQHPGLVRPPGHGAVKIRPNGFGSEFFSKIADNGTHMVSSFSMTKPDF